MTGTRPPDQPKPPPEGMGGTPTEAGLLGRYGLIRPRAGRQVAGVCTAIARVTGTDPVLWRVLIAVGVLFGGVGLLGYLVGWLLMPEEGDTGSPLEALFGRGRSGTSPTVTVLLVTGGAILLVVSVQWTPVAAAVIAGAGYLIYRQQQSALPQQASNRPEPPLVPPAGPPVPPGKPSTGQHGPPPPERSVLGRIALSSVLLALGLVTVVDLAGAALGPSAYVATALTVTGGALVVGAWFGRARSLIVLGMLLSLVLAVTATVESLELRGTGAQTWRPGSVAEIEPRYRVNLGYGNLDLRDVDFAGQDVAVELTVNAGDMALFLPPDVDLTADLRLAYGSAQVLGEDIGGSSARREISDLGADQASGPGKLTARITVNGGNLEVHR